jgi:hypothetical protein
LTAIVIVPLAGRTIGAELAVPTMPGVYAVVVVGVGVGVGAVVKANGSEVGSVIVTNALTVAGAVPVLTSSTVTTTRADSAVLPTANTPFEGVFTGESLEGVLICTPLEGASSWWRIPSTPLEGVPIPTPYDGMCTGSRMERYVER